MTTIRLSVIGERWYMVASHSADVSDIVPELFCGKPLPLPLLASTLAHDAVHFARAQFPGARVFAEVP